MVPKANPAGIESTVVNTTTVTATIMLEVMRLWKSPSSQATRKVCRLNELGRLNPDEQLAGRVQRGQHDAHERHERHRREHGEDTVGEVALERAGGHVRSSTTRVIRTARPRMITPMMAPIAAAEPTWPVTKARW